MHELSMAQAIVDTIMDAAEKNNAEEILEVTIEIRYFSLQHPLLCQQWLGPWIIRALSYLS
ncbi:MAG TPA: hypothetical protein GX531_06610 [Methanothermobacter sp.]|nr:hypothetical protein [Methanothermobacter sp.]